LEIINFPKKYFQQKTFSSRKSFASKQMEHSKLAPIFSQKTHPLKILSLPSLLQISLSSLYLFFMMISLLYISALSYSFFSLSLFFSLRSLPQAATSPLTSSQNPFNPTSLSRKTLALLSLLSTLFLSYLKVLHARQTIKCYLHHIHSCSQTTKNCLFSLKIFCTEIIFP
jgi:formate hydrogenlyase subunit 4